MTTISPARHCVICRAPLEVKPTGRRPSYCSVGCRRAMEYEIRRLQAWRTTLEERRHSLRLTLAGYEVSPPMGTKVAAVTRAELEATEEAIAEAIIRLRDLLAESPTDEAQP